MIRSRFCGSWHGPDLRLQGLTRHLSAPPAGLPGSGSGLGKQGRPVKARRAGAARRRRAGRTIRRADGLSSHRPPDRPQSRAPSSLRAARAASTLQVSGDGARFLFMCRVAYVDLMGVKPVAGIISLVLLQPRRRQPQQRLLPRQAANGLSFVAGQSSAIRYRQANQQTQTTRGQLTTATRNCSHCHSAGSLPSNQAADRYLSNELAHYQTLQKVSPCDQTCIPRIAISS